LRFINKLKELLMN